MLTYIPSIEALERFKTECKHEEANLLTGKCQLCIDALLFMTPIPAPSDSLTASMRIVDEILANTKPPIVLSGDEYLLDLIGRCPSVKIVCPSSIPFSGYVDLSPLESCIALELVRIPFARLTGIDSLRNRLRSLVWIRGYNDEPNDEPDRSIFTTFSFDNRNTLKNNMKVDEIFWDQFGTWPLLSYLCISQSNISHINASTMPPSIKTLDLRMNRIYNFSNRANYSLVSTITKLCLDFNSLKGLPKLNDNSCATLVHLSLRGNLIDSVAGLRNFASLDYLDLSENSICDVRQLLNELMHLSKSLKTVYLEKNPVSCAKTFVSQCQSVLYQLVQFNGTTVKRRIRKVCGDDPESALLPINVDAGLQTSLSTSNQYGTFLPENTAINDSIRSNRIEFDDSFDRHRKTKVSKERFVVINEQGGEDEKEIAAITSSPLLVSPPANVSTHIVTIEIKADINNDSRFKKNYLFGGVSGSYGSFQQLTPNEVPVEVSSSVKSTHLTEDVIQAEKCKLLQKREELGEDWLLGGQSAVQAENGILMNINSELTNKGESPNELTLNGAIENESQHEQHQAPGTVNLDETCEWDEEDTEDENTVFLVEIYPNEGEFAHSLANEASGDYFFIRVRPRDGLLFEKDCTSGKVLTTLDLKILQHYQCLPRDAPESEANTLRLLFDTTITSKRERVYRFVEDDQCDSFVRLYLSSYGQYKNKFEADLVYSFNVSKTLSTTPSNRNLNYTWFYMCLRCGFRTHRIITDCSQCHSDLIIKDEGTSFNGSTDFYKSSTPLQPSSPDNGPNGCLEASEQMFSTGNGYEDMSSTIRDNSSVLSEENFESEPSEIDESYFKANIDHYLKLHIEMYIYEQIADNQLKSESIESVCHCLTYNFASKRFTPALVVFTPNYFFVFDHLIKVDSKQQSVAEGEVRLRFYRQLAGPRASQFIISHLPEHLKNQGYWVECGSSTGDKKKADKKKKRKRSKSKLPDYAIELLLFDDKTIGKAFLQLFMHSHRNCFRSLAEQGNESNLVLIKADISELTHVDEESIMNDEKILLMRRKVTLCFDESCQKLVLDESIGLNDSPYSSPALLGDSTSFFLVRSFNLIPNINGNGVNGKGKNISKDGLFKVEQNLVFMVTKASLVLCQLSAHFAAIAPIIANLRANQSMAQALQSCDNFEDRIYFRLLIKDLIVNLLPNIYIDKGQLMLVLRFRDEDHEATAERHSSGHSPIDQSRPRSGLIVYDFQIQFFNQNTLKRVSKLIQTLWEDNFGVSLTLSKHVPLSI